MLGFFKKEKKKARMTLTGLSPRKRRGKVWKKRLQGTKEKC
jgi:hypothetical protein